MPINPSMILKGLALGLGAAVPIGPVNVEIARRVLRSGFRNGFALGCGAVSVDVTYAILSSLGVRSLLDRPHLRMMIAIAGLVFLVALGVLSIRGALHDLHTDPLSQPEPTPSIHGAYLTGLLMTLLNPVTLAFWFLTVPGTVGSIARDPAHDLPVVCAGVFAGTIAWVIFFCTLLTLLGRLRRRWWLAAADIIGGLLLFGFAAAIGWQLLRA